MSTIIKIFIAIATFGLFMWALSSFGGLTAINAQIAHFKPAFDFIVGNANNLNEVFPVHDLFIAVSAVLSIEAGLLVIKVVRFIMRHNKA